MLLKPKIVVVGGGGGGGVSAVKRDCQFRNFLVHILNILIKRKIKVIFTGCNIQECATGRGICESGR
jgi:hypothetical protein